MMSLRFLRSVGLSRSYSTGVLPKAQLKLKTGHVFEGISCGAQKPVSGEVVFTTSLVGYPESLTDPSYKGQILAFTQPLIGNYGVPSSDKDQFGLLKYFESDHIQTSGIVVGDIADKYSHWNATSSLTEWCIKNDVPAITGIDTRALVKVLRDNGSTLGKIVLGDHKEELETFYNPNERNLVAEASTKEPVVYNKSGKYKIALIDCGAKQNIIRCLAELGAEVHLVPYDYDVSKDPSYDGIFISNGPGNPDFCDPTVKVIKKLLQHDRPVYGICMGNLLMGKAAGLSVRKLPFGNRSHNQAVMNMEDSKCYMTSQNHGYALDDSELPDGWKILYKNIHDDSNEGIAHVTKPFKSVQFHPEAKGGPRDTVSFFEDFMEAVKSKVLQ